ncbi:MAG: PTS transporter subunit EIIB [Bacillota bacterium]
MAPAPITAKSPLPERARGVISGLGGLGNLESVDTCLTRLRVVVKDEANINEPQLKALGSMGKVRTGKNIHQFRLRDHFQRPTGGDAQGDEEREALRGRLPLGRRRHERAGEEDGPTHPGRRLIRCRWS